MIRTKIYALGLACILLISCGEKVRAPTSPDILLLSLKIEYFTANPSTINLGAKSTLSWKVTNCTSVEIDGGIGFVSATGSIEVSPLETTTYTLTAKNTHYEDLYQTYGVLTAGTATETCTITVEN